MSRLRTNITYSLSILLLALIMSCSEGVNLIPDNEPFGSFNISDIKIENYVNRLFIDIVGREPLDEEMASEVAVLKDSELSREVREDLIIKLMTDTMPRVGEGSYRAAYAQNLYNLAKDRCLEGLSDGDVVTFISNEEFGALIDSLEGNWDSYFRRLEEIRRHTELIESRIELEMGNIEYYEMFSFMLNNIFHEIINMNTLNFIRASFDQMLWRFPTQQEFDRAFNMIEFNQTEEIFGSLGANKNDYINILIDSPGMSEGMIIFAFRLYLARDPHPQEIVPILQEYMVDKNFETVIKKILATDEYANFR